MTDKIMSKMNKKKLELKSTWKIRLQLNAEGDKLWADGIFAVYGNVALKWKNYNSKKKDYECHLETGEVFKP